MKTPKVPSEVRDIAEKLSIVKKKEDPNEWILKYIRDLSHASPTKQCCVGATAGAINGYVFGRVGKNAAMILGGSFLMLQVATHMGYVKVNWRAVEKDIDQMKKEMNRHEGVVRPLVQDVCQFLKENVYVGGGFLGGFLVGLAIA